MTTQQLTNQQQIDFWRIQAFNRLEELIKKIPVGANPNDLLIDSLIRAFNRLPARPADKPAYAGIFGSTDPTVGRVKALDQFKAARANLNGALNGVDALIDDLIRALSGLPPRPATRHPYAGIFPEVRVAVLTPEDLLRIVPGARRSRVVELAPHLNQTMIEFDISTPLRQAHFLAQVAHESDRFNALEEYASGTAYEGRRDLGNTQRGDGVRYKGRGLIQVTGRTNYADCGRALGVDLINNPQRLADPDLACRSAGWFWSTRKLNPDADKDDIRTITRVINGGFNGLQDRSELLAHAKQVFRLS
jgi:putative chitinase